MPTLTDRSKTLLLGPGPSNVPSAVRQRLAEPLLGHLDPRFLSILDNCKHLLRQLFRTENAVTFPVSGTGSAGMEAVLVNLLEAGDTIVVGVNGVFGTRLANLAERLGSTAIRVEAAWGEPVPLPDLQAAIATHQPAMVAVVHGETSTGVLQDLSGLAAATHAADALLVVDCVTSLGGAPFEMDAWGVDAAYSGTQKCLNTPPGLAPVSFSPRAIARFHARQSPVSSFYLDLGEILKYVDGSTGRSYHHTAPTAMIAALETACALILQDGLEARWQTHRQASAALITAMADFGFTPLVAEAHRLPPLTTLTVPDHLDEAGLRASLLEQGIEVGAGLGPLAGTVWRIGLMGINANEAKVAQLISAIKHSTST